MNTDPDDFFVEDEPYEDVLAAFERGEKVVTCRPTWVVVRDYERALRQIALDLRPCAGCGEIHKERPVPGKEKMVTWAAESDGHAYRPLSPQAVAEVALSADPELAAAQHLTRADLERMAAEGRPANVWKRP